MIASSLSTSLHRKVDQWKALAGALAAAASCKLWTRAMRASMSGQDEDVCMWLVMHIMMWGPLQPDADEQGQTGIHTSQAAIARCCHRTRGGPFSAEN